MSQKKKARALAEKRFEFQTTTSLPVGAIAAACDRAAEGATIRMKSWRAEAVTVEAGEEKSTAVYAVNLYWTKKQKGKGSTCLTFVVSADKTSEGQTLVELKVGDFDFHKGGLFSKPTIVAGDYMKRYVPLLKTELAAG